MKNALCKTNQRIEEIKIRRSEIETFEYSINDFTKMMVDRTEYDTLERELHQLNQTKRHLEFEILESEKATNVGKIKVQIENQGYEVGCIDELVNKLTKKELEKIIENINGETTDVDVYIRKKLHVAEIVEVDGEIDVIILTQAEYISRYGNERWYEEE